MSLPRLFLSAVVALCAAGPARASRTNRAASATEARDREIAARFAPVFHQALGDSKRADYLTRFDFDGDWRGDNNRAYAVSETANHFFVDYAVFHPRDYKGGRAGLLLNEAIRLGSRGASFRGLVGAPGAARPLGAGSTAKSGRPRPAHSSSTRPPPSKDTSAWAETSPPPTSTRSSSACAGGKAHARSKPYVDEHRKTLLP